MNKEPYGTTVFCDDIRQEVSGKVTLVGCYFDELVFNGPSPGLMHSFAVVTKIILPLNFIFKKMAVVITKVEGDQVVELSRTELTPEDEDEFNAGAEAVKPDEVAPTDKVMQFILPAQFTPFEMREPGRVQVRAYFDDEREVKLGALGVRFTQ